MVQAARQSAAGLALPNAEFLERDWYRYDGVEFHRRFDIAFAHTTPAIVDYDTFTKLMDASRRYCLFCMHGRRSNQVMDELRGMVGMEPGGDDSVAYVFDTIWHHGGDPEIDYEKKVWQSKRKLEDAEKWYLGRLNGVRKLTAVQEDAVRARLAELAVDGMVEEISRTTLVSLFWEV